MRRAAPAKISEVTIDGTIAAVGGETNSRARLSSVEWVRVSPAAYLSALFFFSLVAGFLSYLEQIAIAQFLLAASWLFLPILAWFDRITFDGESLRRTGWLPRFFGKIFGQPLRLKIADIEQVETQSLRALKSGGRVYYRYRSEVRGQDLNFAFASGGKNFRRMVRRLFPLVLEDKLDSRSVELRDYLAESEETNRLVEALHIPSAEVAENSLKRLRSLDKKRKTSKPESVGAETAQQSGLLRAAANQLRLSGNLPQSLEAFRRALFLAPSDAWVLFEFSRGLHSYAAASREAKLMRRALAALRLAARQGWDNARLLARIGESYFQYGETKHAERVYRRVLELDAENFRAVCGLAETALNEGKLAHVSHNYQAAVRIAPDEATKNWASEEAEYFSLLNVDEDYMDAELMRIGWLQNVERGVRICFRLTLAGLFVILFGATAEDELITQLGLAIAAGTASLWLILNLAGKVLQNRCEPFDESED